MKIYVGNLSFDIKEDELRQAFESYGQVESVNIIKDMYSGRSKGFGFVEMASNAEAQAAMEGLNGKELKGRAMKVNESQSRPQGGARRGGPRPGGGGGGPRRGGSGGGGRRF